MMVYDYNTAPLNQHAATLLQANRIPFNPRTELATVVLMREAINLSLLEMPTLDEPELLMAKLQANPALAMQLLTVTDSGDEIMWNDPLPEDLAEAAATVMEELHASLATLTSAH